MLGPRLGRQARGVGGQEGKRPFRVAAVLGQIEVDTADQIPGRVQRLEESLQISSGCGECRGKRGAEIGPQPTQDIGGQVFRPRHHRGRQDECGEFGLGRRGNGGQDCGGRPLSGPTRPVKTDRLHIAYGEIAPPDEGGRQGLADLARSKLQQPIPGATAKGLASRAATLSSRVGASFASSSRRCPRGVRRNCIRGIVGERTPKGLNPRCSLYRSRNIH